MTRAQTLTKHQFYKALSDPDQMKIYEFTNSFIIQPYRRSYLSEYHYRMNSDNLNSLIDNNVAAVLEEQGYEWEESPRSVYKVQKLYEALNKYSPDRSPSIDINDKNIQEGIRFAYACFARKNNQDYLETQSFSPEFVWSITSNHKGSAGLTAWGQTKAESVTRAYERGLQQILGVKKPEPCIAFKRTQFDDKTRLVWGYPYAMTAIEGIFARPLIDFFKLGGTPMAFAMRTVDMGTMLRVASYHKNFAYSIDVSSFDASASQQLIHTAFQILSTWFDMSLIEPTSGCTLQSIYDKIEYYFIHTPIVMPNLCVYKGKVHGVPSGSYFTQMIDSIINTIYVGAIASEFNLFIDKSELLVLGDDVIFWSNRDVSLEHIANFATRTFQAEFNWKKCSKFRSTDPVHYLGRDWKEGVPNLPKQDIIKRMVYPETFRKYPRDKGRIDRQVRLLLMSYAAVYHDAYGIYIQSLDLSQRHWVDDERLELTVIGDDGEIDPNNLSGYQRFKLKYLTPKDGSHTPICIQFWT